MRILVLDGFPERSQAASAAVSAVEREAVERGWEAEVLRPGDLALAPCTGCFDCWEQTPGRCVQTDDSPALLRAILRAHILFLLTPVTYGGYSPGLKIAFDRGIPLLSPLFRVVGGEVHHLMRYERSRSLAALGVLRGPDADAETVFSTVVRRNAVNFDARSVATGTVTEGTAAEAVAGEVCRLLAEVQGPGTGKLQIARLDRALWAGNGNVRLTLQSREGKRRAVLLTGSPRSPSNSSSLGDYAADRLAGLGWETKSVRIPSSGRSGDWAVSAAAADLVFLATPLYADGLPTHLIRALGALAAALGEAPPRPRGLACIVNCGFPEAHNNHTALAMLRLFSRDAGLCWMGGLPMGMGEILGRSPLENRGRMVRNVMRALDLAAEALDEGRALPEEAVDLISRPVVPRWMYVFFGNRGWKSRARRNGVADLAARPLEEEQGKS